MATVDDIDTQGLVGKFLQRQIITPTTDDEADNLEEVQALLETVATTFLLTPQAAMPLILRGKNSLQQLVQSDIAILDFLISAIADIRNPDAAIEDTSDLVEAQTALVELDRLGRVGDELQAFQRYKAAINRFMDNELAFFLKRNARKEFERSGIEAREDIFTALPQFEATHRVMADRLADLQNSVTDFRSVGLNKLVSARTVAEVRTSLREIKSLVDRDSISKTVTATELLAGVASLESISENSDIFDLTISTAEGLPPRRVITIRPEQLGATALSTDGPWDASGSDRVFSLKVNPLAASPVSLSPELPDTGVEDTGGDATVYVTSSEAASAATYLIPASGTMYLRVVGSGTPDQEVSITSGTRTVAQILTDLNIGLVDAVAIAFKGGNRFLIYGDDPAITSVIILGGSPGDLGVINTDPSVHDVLGFEVNQASLPRGEFNALSLKDALEGRLPGVTMSVEGDKFRLTSDSTDPAVSSLEFDTTVADDVQGVFGFIDTAESEPSFMELIEDGVAISLAAEGVYIGSLVTAAEASIPGSALRSLNNEPITAVDDTQMSFVPGLLPRGGNLDVSVTSPEVVAIQELVQSLADFVGVFEEDFQDLQLALAPILSAPTQAQSNDALRVLNRVRDKLTDLVNGGVLEALEAIVVRIDQSSFLSQADVLTQSLEERGLDKAGELLSTGRFSEFFALTKSSASRASKLLLSMESFVSKDIPISYNEELIDDDNPPVGSNPNQNALDDVEPNDINERLIEDL